MATLQKESVNGIYTLIRPNAALPLVFDSPHSGVTYPEDFDYACDFAALEKAEDKYVDELFMAAPEHGAIFLHADFPRSYIDVNRCAMDIDVDLLEDEWTDEINTTPRSHAGIGLIRRLVRPGMPLYDRQLKVSEIKQRIEKYYIPYHAALERAIEELHYNPKQWRLRFLEIRSRLCHQSISSRNQLHTFADIPTRCCAARQRLQHLPKCASIQRRAFRQYRFLRTSGRRVPKQIQ